MTTKFPTKEDALKFGLKYAGRESDLSLLTKVEGADITQFGEPLGADVYDLVNCKGQPCRIGTAPFRDGFDLWLMNVSGTLANRI